MSDSSQNGTDQTQPQRYYEEDAISLIDIVAVLWKRKWMIIGITAAAAIGVVVFSIISLVLPPEQSPLPNYYEPEAMVLVTGDSSAPSFGQAASSALGELAGLAGITGGGGGSYGPLAVELAKSRSVLDSVGEQLNVGERIENKENLNTKIRRLLRENSTVEFESGTGLLRVSYQSTDEEFATEAVNALVSTLNERFRTIGGSRAVTRRELLEEKIAEVESRIAQLEAKISEFTAQYGILDVETVTQEQAQTMANLRSDLILKELEIQSYSEFARIDDPVLRRLRTERDNLRQTLRDMEQGSTEFEGVLPSQQDIPELAFEYERLRRNLDVQAQIYRNLASELELARLNAEGQEPVFQILELAEVPEVKAGPSRATISVVAAAAAFVLSILLAFVSEYVTKLRSDQKEIGQSRLHSNVQKQ